MTHFRRIVAFHGAIVTEHLRVEEWNIRGIKVGRKSIFWGVPRSLSLLENVYFTTQSYILWSGTDSLLESGSVRPGRTADHVRCSSQKENNVHSNGKCAQEKKSLIGFAEDCMQATPVQHVELNAYPGLTCAHSSEHDRLWILQVLINMALRCLPSWTITQHYYLTVGLSSYTLHINRADESNYLWAMAPLFHITWLISCF